MEEQPYSYANGDSRREDSPLSENEMRYMPRWKVKNRVKYVLKDGSFSGIEECETMDLSCSGACLRLPRSLIPGQDVKLEIFLEDGNAVEVEGRVIWNRIKEGERHAGVMFEAMSSEIQDMILNHAFEVSPDELVKHWFSGWDKDRS